MQAPRPEAHRAQAKNAEDGAPFPPPLMSPRRTRMNPGTNQGEKTIPSVCMPQMMMWHIYWPNHRFPPQPPKTNVAGLDELLKELVASLQDENTKGPKVQQQLADIAIKRWGTKLQSDKISSILGKHPQPENCEEMAIAQVNPQIWAPLNAAKRKADLRLANMQQALKKATFAIVTTCDKLLAVKSQIETKEMVTDSVDAIALVGHVVSEIFSIRREQLRPSLK